MTIMPPGFTEGAFRAVLAEISAIVGQEWIFTAEEDLYTYRDSYSPLWDTPDERLASAGVAPASVEELQAVVKVAAKHRLPIYPISTGKNLGYGGAAPNYSGSVVIDLKRMNRILEIDETRCFALVEPGVSYFDLYNEIQKRGSNLWIDCPEPGWGSVLGNALERGIGYTHTNYRDHWGAHCGLEVVLANGEVMRTGMGAMPGAQTWQDNPYGFGPLVDGLFSQGNFGIVTKMGIRLMAAPEGLRAGNIQVSRYRDIIPLVAKLNHLESQTMIDGLPQITSPVFGGIVEPPNPEITKLLATAGGASDEALEAFANGKPYWNLRVLMYGPETVTAAKWEYVQTQFRQVLPEATFSESTTYKLPLSAEAQEALSIIDLAMERKVTFGLPNLGIFLMGARSPVFPTPSDGHIWFSPIIPRSGEAIIKAQNVFAKALLEKGVFTGGNAAMPASIIPRCFLMIFPVFLSHDDLEQNKHALATIDYLIEIAAQNGWGEYRAAPALQDKIMGTYDFGEHALRRFIERLKDAVDPDGILAAGRCGIWPKNLREGRR